MFKKSKISRHYWRAELKKWKWIPEENRIDESYIEVEKDFSTKELKEYLKKEKLATLGYTLLGALVGCIGFLGNWIFGLLSVAGVALFGMMCSILTYYLYNYKSEYFYDLGEQDGYREDTRLTYIFAEELAKLKEEKLEQEKLAEKWRKKHPLEEKIRLALTQNPNYIADLLRYCELVKPNKTTEKQRIKREEKQKEIELANQAIKVKYLGDEI